MCPLPLTHVVTYAFTLWCIQAILKALAQEAQLWSILLPSPVPWPHVEAYFPLPPPNTFYLVLHGIIFSSSSNCGSFSFVIIMFIQEKHILNDWIYTHIYLMSLKLSSWQYLLKSKALIIFSLRDEKQLTPATAKMFFLPPIWVASRVPSSIFSFSLIWVASQLPRSLTSSLYSDWLLSSHWAEVPVAKVKAFLSAGGAVTRPRVCAVPVFGEMISARSMCSYCVRLRTLCYTLSFTLFIWRDVLHASSGFILLLIIQGYLWGRRLWDLLNWCSAVPAIGNDSIPVHVSCCWFWVLVCSYVLVDIDLHFAFEWGRQLHLWILSYLALTSFISIWFICLFLLSVYSSVTFWHFYISALLADFVLAMKNPFYHVYI